MATDVATLGIRVDATGATTGLNTVESGLSRVTKAAAALGITLSAGAIFSKMVRESIDAQYAMAQLEARVKSTGMAAGFSAPQLAALAGQMQDLTTFSDEAVMGAQSLLLTFTKIKGDTLPAATQAVADLATAMGGDLKGAALQVGKALQDPEQGLLALRRSGVSFSEAQQDVIKGLFETGRQAEAQAMILAELKKEFGGAAEAARGTLGGALTGLTNAFGELFEISKAGTSGIVGFIEATTRSVKELNEMRGAITGVAVALGTAGLAGGLAAGVTAIGAMVGGIATLTEALIAARLAAAAFWVTVTGPMGVAIAGLTALSLITAKIFSDDAKANAAMDAREDADRYMVQQALKRRDAEKAVGEEKRLTALASELAAQKQAAADAAELAGLEGKIRGERAMANAKQLIIDKLDKELALREKINTLLSGNGPSPKVGGGLAMPTITTRIGTGSAPPSGSPFNTAGGQNPADYKRWLDETVRMDAAAAALKQEIYGNFLRGLQENFATTFQNIFTRGIKSFGDLFKGMKDLFLNAISQMLAAKAMQKIAAFMGSLMVAKPVAASDTANAATSGSGGLLGLISAHPVLAGIAAVGVAMLAMGARARQAAKDVEEMTKALNVSIERYRADAGLSPKEDTSIADAKDRAEKLRAEVRAKAEREIDVVNANMWTTRWHKEKRAAEIWAAAQPALDKINEAERVLIALREKEAAAIEAARVVQQAWNTARAQDDLKVRDLKLRGLADEAEAQELFNQQVREFAAAVAEVNKGLLSEEYLKELGAVQQREREALAASQAAAKVAANRTAQDDLAVRQLQAEGRTAEADAMRRALDQQREYDAAVKAGLDAATLAALKLVQAAESAAAAAQMAAQQAAAQQDLEVELLQAQGKTKEADQLAFDLEQQRRLEAAQKDQTAEYVAKLKELQELQRQNRAASLTGGGASEAAASTASNVFAGADTVTASFGTKVSAEVGDRMLDNLVSIRVILRAIEGNTRNLGGRLNTSLGLSLADARALSGSSVLS